MRPCSRLSLLIPAALCVASLSSCLSQNYLIPKSWGEWQEATISELRYEHLTNPPAQPQSRDSVQVQFMRVGNDFYEPCVQTRCRSRHEFPNISLSVLGSAGEEHLLLPSASDQRGWRKSDVSRTWNGELLASPQPLKDAPFLQSLPPGATPVMVNCFPITHDSLYWEGLGKTHADWHALYAYPLAGATAACIDVPVMIIGNIAFGITTWVLGLTH